MSGAAQLWSSATLSLLSEVKPSSAGAPRNHARQRLTDKAGRTEGGSALPVLPPLERRCGSVWKYSPYGYDFLSYSFFFSPTFFPLLLQQKGGASPPPHHHPPSTPAHLPRCAVRWRELLSLWSDCVNAVRSGTSHSALAPALMLSVS